MALDLKHQSLAEFAARFWARVAAAQANNKAEFCRLMYWLERRLDGGDLTDAQVRTSFNAAFGRSLTAGQWTTLRNNRIIPAHDKYAAILTEGAL